MNDFRITADDPRLTAYALGELEGEEQQQIDAAVRADPTLQTEVAAIRALAGRMNDALAVEALPEVAEPSGSLQKAAIIPGRPGQLDGGPLRAEAAKQMGSLLRFSRWYLAAGGLAAACLVLVLALHTAPPTGQTEGPVTQQLQAKAERARPAPLPAQTAAVETSAAAQPRLADRPLVAAAPRDEGGAVTDAASPAAAVVATSSPVVVSAPERGAEAEQIRPASEAKPAPPKFEDFAAVAPPPAPPVAGQPLLKQVERLPDLSKASSFAAPGSTHFAAKGRAELREMQQQVSRARREKNDVASQTLLVANDEAVVLSPFRVEGGATGGYLASTTLAGTRVRGEHREVMNTEAYRFLRESDFLSAREHPLSTFAADVDTASYANVRRFLREGRLPPADAVRIEELVNYFPYRYPAPGKGRDAGVAAPGKSNAHRDEGVAAPGDAPFAASLEVAAAPWAAQHRLVRIGLKAKEAAVSGRAPANLVFLLDVSGSMDQPNKLPLVQESMRLLLGRLQPEDRVAIVTYAGHSGLALASTPVTRQRDILDAIDALRAGGSTNGAMGLQLAYDIAKANFVANGVNRVILCTDGDFNVGVTSEGELVRLIEEKAKSGVFLTVLGFGMGNIKDATLQQIADRGNGSYGYIDTRREADRLLVQQVSGTLLTVAKDVKLQVEFNPEKVARYRLIGYEKRLLNPEDFANDKIDAGEIGAGHTVTALYEIIPVGASDAPEEAEPEDRRYTYFSASPSAVGKRTPAHADELLTLKVRYKQPAALLSSRLEFPLKDGGASFAQASEDFRFASAVAAFGMILRDSPHKGTATLDDVATWAHAATSDDPGGYRAEFVELVRQAKHLAQP